MRSVDQLRQCIATKTIGQAAEDLGLLPGADLSTEISSRLIDSSLNHLDALFSTICAKYSHFSMLVAIQHHLPALLIMDRADQTGDSQELFNAMSLVAMKFCTNHARARIRLTYRQYRKGVDQFFNQVESLQEDLLGLQIGVKQLRSLVNTRRSLHKGALVSLADDRISLNVEYPEEVSGAIAVFENRAWRSANVLGWQGYFIPLAPLRDDSSFDIPVVRIDWDALRNLGTPPLLQTPPVVTTIDSLFLVFHGSLFFEQQIAQVFDYKVGIADLFTFVHAICYPTLARLNSCLSPYGWGYDFWSWRGFRRHIATRAPKSYWALMILIWKHIDSDALALRRGGDPLYWALVYRSLLSYLAYDYRHPEKIEHRRGYPCKFLFTTEQGVFAHMGLFVSYLHSMWSQFEVTGEIGGQKGPAFEQTTYAFLMSEDFTPVWAPGRPFPYRVGKRSGTDIDLFFRKGNVGFVISCKSYANTKEIYDGDRRAVWLRWTDLQSWVKENDELADAMVKHAGDIGIPTDIKALIPVVCVPHVEYLWDVSSWYMLSPDLPRVLTPWELREWAKQVDMHELHELPFCRHL